MTNLYQDLDGRIACFDHLGGYAQAAFSRSPRSRRQETPLTVWERLSEADIVEIESIVHDDYVLENFTVACEECAYDERMKEKN